MSGSLQPGSITCEPWPGYSRRAARPVRTAKWASHPRRPPRDRRLDPGGIASRISSGAIGGLTAEGGSCCGLNYCGRQLDRHREFRVFLCDQVVNGGPKRLRLAVKRRSACDSHGGRNIGETQDPQSAATSTVATRTEFLAGTGVARSGEGGLYVPAWRASRLEPTETIPED